MGCDSQECLLLTIFLGWKQKLLAYSLRGDTGVTVCWGLLVRSAQVLLPSLLRSLALGTHAPDLPGRQSKAFTPERNQEKSVNVIGAWFLVSTLNTV